MAKHMNMVGGPCWFGALGLVPLGPTWIRRWPTDIFGEGAKWWNLFLHLTNTYVSENFEGGNCPIAPPLVAGLDHSISGLFRPEELAAALRRLKPGKSLGLDSIFPELVFHAGSALKFWFCDFLTSCLRQFKIPKIWRRALVAAIPKPEKPLGDQRAIALYLLCASPSRSLRDSSTLVSNQSSTHCSRVFDTGGQP